MGRVFASECSQFKYINSATKCCNKKKPNFPIVTKKKPRQFLLKTATFQISPKSHYKVLTIFCKIIFGYNLVTLVLTLRILSIRSAKSNSTFQLKYLVDRFVLIRKCFKIANCTNICLSSMVNCQEDLVLRYKRTIH